MNFDRKFAFFVRETAVLHHNIFNETTAHSLLLLVAKYYGLYYITAHQSKIRSDHSKKESIQSKMESDHCNVEGNDLMIFFFLSVYSHSL